MTSAYTYNLARAAASGMAVGAIVSCAYLFGPNPHVVKPLPTRPCAGVYSSDSLEVCRDTATVRR